MSRVGGEYLQRILTARVYQVARETPLEPAARLGSRFGRPIWLKREDLQPVFSFKLRGAANKLARLPCPALAGGVLCASAGNHGQGVALAAARVGIRATIVMPATAPAIKVEAVERLGGEPLLHGDSFEEACGYARRLAGKRGATFIHPFDDPDIIAGQGTIAVELLRQLAAPEAIFMPVGGGGLAAGIASYVKSLRPETRLIAVEPVDAACLAAALAAGRPVELDSVGQFADGAAVRRVGDETFRLCRGLIDEVVLVDTDEICAAIKDIFEDTRSLAEPAGALAVAGMKRWLAAAERPGGRDLVAIVSGANTNFDRLRHVAERAALGERRETLLAVQIPERCGSFLDFCRLVGPRQVTEFNYRYSDPQRAWIFVGVALRHGLREKDELVARLAAAGYRLFDLSDNEMAKLHVRYMVGGRNTGVSDELICRFEFPERPGALLGFLQAVGVRWNISLFHYRNHGSDCGRVLAGVQVPPAERAAYTAHLRALGYPYRDETANLAYRAFLGIDGGDPASSRALQSAAG